MKLFLLALGFVHLCNSAVAQDINVLLQDAKKYEIALNENEAFNSYKQILGIQPTHMYALTRCSELAGSLGGRETDKNKKLEYYNASKAYAETALQVKPDDPGANYARAAVSDRYALLYSAKDKMKEVRDMKKYAELALRGDSSYAKALYILGKWHYIVSSLSGVERTEAKLLYGGMPNASLEQAIKLLDKARTMDQFLVVAYLYLAKAYVSNHQSDKAIDVLNKMAHLPNRTQDDPGFKAEGKKMVADLQ